MKNLSTIELSKLLREKKLSALELARYYVNQAEKLNPSVNALVTLNENIFEEARAADKLIARGEFKPLLGIPMAVKDNICTENIKTTCGSHILENYVPPYSATAVKKLQEAGAIVLGKSNLDEFGMGSACENSIFGPAKNPVDISYSPGGSSGGSAAAVAAGLAPFALGSDTGGSVRLPASHCGIVGMKPTYGAVSRYGLVAFASSLDQIGPMTGTVADNALVLALMAGKDPMDATSVDTKLKKAEAEKLKVGIIKEFAHVKIMPEVQAAMDRALALYSSLGFETVEVSVPHIGYAAEAYYIISSAEASSNLARFDGVRYGRRSKTCKDIRELYKRSRGEGFGTEVKRRIMLGTFVLSSDCYDRYYKNALAVKALIAREFELALQSCDLIVSPVSPEAAKLIGEKCSPADVYSRDIFTVPGNLAGLPALSVPFGADKKGLPIGIQLMAGKFREDILYAAGELLERGGEL